MWWLLAIPLLLIVLLGLFVLAVVGLLFGALKAMPWLLILVGIWLLLRDRRHDRGHQQSAWVAPRGHSQHDWREESGRGWHGGHPQSPPRASERQASRLTPPTPPQARAAAAPRRELPVDVKVKVEQIRRKADVLLGYADRFPPFSQDLYLVRQTTADYLPRTTAAYLALPGFDDPIVTATGRTALQELRDQLQLLDSKLDDITQDLQRQDLDRLLANRRFLEERFRLREVDPGVEPPRQGSDAA